MPQLHIKLRLTKQFVNSLNRDRAYFRYLSHKSPEISAEKLKALISDNSQIQKLFEDPQYKSTMNKIKSNTCSGNKKNIG